MASAPKSLPASSVTAPNTASAGLPLAATVATRRSAACSAAIELSVSRLCSSTPTIELNVRCMLPISTGPSVATRTLRSPPATLSAADTSRCSGRATITARDRVRMATPSSEVAKPAIPATKARCPAIIASCRPRSTVVRCASAKSSNCWRSEEICRWPARIDSALMFFGTAPSSMAMAGSA